MSSMPLPFGAAGYNVIDTFAFWGRSGGSQDNSSKQLDRFEFRILFHKKELEMILFIILLEEAFP